MTTTLIPSAVPENEYEALVELQEKLPSGSALGSVLATVSDGIRDGAEVTVARGDDSLTPAQAAKILGVSRTHLYKVLDSGALRFYVVGERDRRIRRSDLTAYFDATMKLRAADAEAIARRTELEDEVFNAL